MQNRGSCHKNLGVRSSKSNNENIRNIVHIIALRNVMQPPGRSSKYETGEGGGGLKGIQGKSNREVIKKQNYKTVQMVAQ